ncbi:hypothetical protein D3C87_369350 [compost metagenome]
MRIKVKTQTFAMERLEAILKEIFPELNYLNVSLDVEYFYMEFASNTKDMAAIMRKLDAFVRPYIAKHGDREVSYVFNINKGKDLVNIIRYNEQADGFKVMVNVNGKEQRLFVVDLLGIGDYSVFNQEFECLGIMYRPVRTPAMGQYRMDTVTSFTDASYWTTSSKVLSPYLTNIINSISEKLSKS